MGDPTTVPSGAALSTRPLFYPSSLILIAANLLPLAGVLFWRWDAFVILVLYWFETAIIGFWTLVRVATASREALGGITMTGSTRPPSPIGLALFFILHAGIFMGVHFAFLWALFSGDWASRIHGPREFVEKLIIGTDLWIPLLVLFVARGIVFFYSAIRARLQRWLNPQRPVRAKPAPPDSIARAIVGGFYARIIVMHIAILFGGFLSFFGSIAPLIILIAIKTAVDLGIHFAFDLGDADKTFRALMRHDAQQRQGGSRS
ncbi:MAG: hypothetical protein QOH67_628 [Hyphomicrobiales bacterium]|jgi:hypothetical protein|nr:hypothetical protein [Hyphomicrobiales bacterium]